jgi:DNA repair exonuclease SbcCD ATPase subunit
MDPDPPTRRIAPGAAPASTPHPFVTVEEQRLAHADLVDRIKSLRAWLAFATILALLALGAAAWALVSKEEEDDTRAGASRTSVSRLDSRVDDLEEQVDDRATKGAVSELRGQQEELSEQVQQLGGQADGGDTEAVQQSVEELSASVQQLEQRLDELEQQQAEQPVP